MNVPATPTAGRPRTLLWILTANCNLACRHCYATRLPRGELSPQEVERVVRSAADAGVEHLSLSGGEALLYPGALDIFTLATELGMSTSLITNGLAVDGECATILSQCSTRVTVSLDGANATSHDLIRGRGSWQAARAAIDRLQERGVVLSSVMAVSRLNRREVAGYVRLARELGLAAACLIPVMRAGRAGADLAPSPEEMAQAIGDAAEAAEQAGIDVTLWCMPFAGSLNRSERLHFSSCRNSSEIELDPMGNVLLCDIIDPVVCNIWRKSIPDVWRELREYPLYRTLRMPPPAAPCAGCAEFALCKGGCFARADFAGDIAGPDPLCPHVGGREVRSGSQPE